MMHRHTSPNSRAFAIGMFCLAAIAAVLQPLPVLESFGYADDSPPGILSAPPPGADVSEAPKSNKSGSTFSKPSSSIDLGSAFNEAGLPGNTLRSGTLRSGLGREGSGFGQISSKPYQLSSTYRLNEDKLSGEISVTANLGDQYSIYSVTQPKGGPLATKLNFVDSKKYQLAGVWAPDQKPKVSTNEKGFEGFTVEKHYASVTWTAPFKSTSPIDANTDSIEMTVFGQVCKVACIGIQNEIVVSHFEGPSTGTNAPPNPSVAPSEFKPLGPIEMSLSDGQPSGSGQEKFRDPKARTSWSAVLSSNVAKPGSQVELLIQATTDLRYHVYEVRVDDPSIDASTTIIASEKGGLQFGKPKPDKAPRKKELIPGKLTVAYHGATVTWKVPIFVPKSTTDGNYPISVLVGYQACNDDSCEEPLGIQIDGQIAVDQNAKEGESKSLSIKSISNKSVVESPLRLTWFDTLPSDAPMMASKSVQGPSSDSEITATPVPYPGDQEDELSAAPLTGSQLFTTFALAMLGGFVLNFMPCVLPVIGLKIMSFMQEGKKGGIHSSILNLWYVAGILSVFVALAILTIVVRETTGHGFGWGEQFGSFGFRLALTILMFAMGLSFLGVWEIPIPGFATSKTSSEMMKKEGVAGAYFKGLLTTVLATPCSGPGLGAVFSLAIRQPSWIIILMYLGVGLGMGFPYLVIAVWPKAVGFLPKPGEWMQTLKEFLAFPLLLSAVWFLTTFSDEHRIAVVTILIGVWFACWWIGKVPPWAEFGKKSMHAFGAICLTGFVIWGSLKYLGPHDKIIDWRPYNEAELIALRNEGKTVMIDFTAQWCALCKVNLASVIETQKVAQFIRNNDIVPMLADMTDFAPEVKSKLEELNSNSIPVLAIYPADLNRKPIVLRDQLTTGQLLKKLEEAKENAEPPSDISVEKTPPPESLDANSKSLQLPVSMSPPPVPNDIAAPPALKSVKTVQEQRVRDAARKRGEITFDDLKFDIEKDGVFESKMLTDSIKELDGKTVRLRGFILPTSVFQQKGFDRFVLVRDNQECCFGPGAAIYDCVMIEMEPGKTADYSTRVVQVQGTFHIDTESFRYPEGNPFAVFKIIANEVK